MDAIRSIRSLKRLAWQTPHLFWLWTASWPTKWTVSKQLLKAFMGSVPQAVTTIPEGCKVKMATRQQLGYWLGCFRMAGNEGEERVDKKIISSVCIDWVLPLCGSKCEASAGQSTSRASTRCWNYDSDEDPFADIVAEQVVCCKTPKHLVYMYPALH